MGVRVESSYARDSGAGLQESGIVLVILSLVFRSLLYNIFLSLLYSSIYLFQYLLSATLL